MGRKKKPKDIQEKIVCLDIDIAKTEEALKALKIQRKELQEQLKQEKMQKLMDTINTSGKTVEDIISML